jgi:hypothetical protein
MSLLLLIMPQITGESRWRTNRGIIAAGRDEATNVQDLIGRRLRLLSDESSIAALSGLNYR